MHVAKWIYALLVLVVCELIADVLAKQFALTGMLALGVGAILGYMAANAAWLISLRAGAELGKGAVLFAVLSSIGAVAIGLFVYHESVGPYAIVGLILGVASILLLSIT